MFLPFLALREQPAGSFGTQPTPHASAGTPSTTGDAPEDLRLPYYAPFMGAVAGIVGVVSVAWAVVGREEFGGLTERWNWTVGAFTGNRVFFAFVLDLAFYTTWQVVFLHKAEGKYRYVPFAGLVAWLLAGGPKKQPDRQNA